MQFSDAVDAGGKSQARTGTTAGLAMVLEEGSGAGLSGWGWNDANYGGPASPVYFASSGPHTLRLQEREDGIQIDQIVISSAAYTNKRPGVDPHRHDDRARHSRIDDGRVGNSPLRRRGRLSGRAHGG